MNRSAKCGTNIFEFMAGEAHLPFGGIEATGVGHREVGHMALDFYTELKTVYVDYTGRKRESSIY